MSFYSPEYIYQINEINNMISGYKDQLEYTSKYKNVLNELKESNKNTGKGWYKRRDKDVYYSYFNNEDIFQHMGEEYCVYSRYLNIQELGKCSYKEFTLEERVKEQNDVRQIRYGITETYDYDSDEETNESY